MVQLTSKQEKFCQLLIDPDHSQASAYRAAYNVGKDTSDDTVYVLASRTAKAVKVRSRLQELRIEAYEASPWDAGKLHQKLEMRSDDAADAKQYGPSVRALEMIGKLDGLIVDKKELAITGTVAHIQLSTDELRQLVLDGRRIAAQYGLDAAKIIEAD
jgi:phage terminase small subunit